MSESRNKKGRSVAAFMFMPQFHLCFEGFAHLIPVFMRTLAVMFAQAGLIANNHPATRYGIEGVRKYSFVELMGEAWFTLRTTRATPYQWGMFSSVVMMIGFVVCAAGSFFLSTFFNLGAVARAQLFDHPGQVYPTAGETGMDQAAMYGGSGGVFDTYYSDSPSDHANASSDFAFMMLDKVLRQGAMNAGGSSQTALRALMETYNTGVLVIASVLLFWMILSIVVDTAKTGVVGGGRHNMVWAPIRVVFALGIMIPLGGTGFSSGQFMVMKLAEWGSNFGTQMWVKYITAATSTQSLMPAFRAQNVAGLVAGIAKIKTCQVVYNAASNQGANILGLAQVITPRARTVDEIRTINYTNQMGTESLCGSVWFTTGAASDRQQQIEDSAILGTSVPLTVMSIGFTLQMQAAMAGILDETVDNAGIYAGDAKSFACAFAYTQAGFSDGGNPAQHPVVAPGFGQICGSSVNVNACGGVAPVIGSDCHQRMATAIVDAMSTTYNSAKVAHLDGDVNSYMSGGIVTDMESRGWGGMGMWYQIVSVLTKLSSEARKVSGGFNPGSAWSTDSNANLNEHVAKAMKAYDEWWEIARTEAPNINTGGDWRQKGQNLNTGGVSKSNIKEMSEKATSSSDGSDAAETVMRSIFPSDSEDFIFDIIDGSGDDVYPMAAVSATGDQITAIGFGILAVITAIGFFDRPSASALGFGGSLGAAISGSAIANGMSTMGGAMIIAGLVLSFYIPVLPMIRVAFAVLTWVISVFEAVCMVPIAALAHLTSEGDGIAGGAKHAWILWLNVLLRPALVVLGFVGAMLAYNAFIIFFQVSFASLTASLSATSTWYGKFMGMFAYTLIYMSAIYSAANMVFKMLDMLPNALMRYMGGSADTSFDDHDSAGYMVAGSKLMEGFKSTKQKKIEGKTNDDKTGTTKEASNTGSSGSGNTGGGSGGGSSTTT